MKVCISYTQHTYESEGVYFVREYRFVFHAHSIHVRMRFCVCACVYSCMRACMYTANVEVGRALKRKWCCMLVNVCMFVGACTEKERGFVCG